ncbi:MAG: branched-chain amino acid ABC transporter permease [Bacillota bacterium]|nr:MAG: branched-chain amino acid ABC transporter permease [Bacillota bacterium]
MAFTYVKQFCKKVQWKRYTTYYVIAALFAVLLLLDLFNVLDSANSRYMMLVAVYAIMAISLNLVVGVLGELSLGHAGFIAVGAYAGALVSKALQAALPAAVYFPISMIAGGLVAAVFGVVIGLPVLRLKGDYIAIVTLAFCMIIYTVFINLGFTGGAAGLKDIPTVTTYINAFIVLIVAAVIIQNFVRSKHGRAIMSIRDNEIAARASGINITYYKLFAFTLSAFIAGVGGCLYAHTGPILRPNSMDYNMSIEILVMVVLGGMGSMTGSFVAAAVLTLLPEYLRFLQDFRMIIYAVVLILIMIVNNNATLKGYKDRFIAWCKCILAKCWKKCTRALKRKENAAETAGEAPEIPEKMSEVDETSLDDTERKGEK